LHTSALDSKDDEEYKMAHPAATASVPCEPIFASSNRDMYAPMPKRRMADIRSSLDLDHFFGVGNSASCTQILVRTTLAVYYVGAMPGSAWEALNGENRPTPVPRDSPTTPCRPIDALNNPIVTKPYALCQLGSARFRLKAGSLQRSGRRVSAAQSSLRVK
jgi:hypothetical protein